MCLSIKSGIYGRFEVTYEEVELRKMYEIVDNFEEYQDFPIKRYGRFEVFDIVIIYSGRFKIIVNL